MKPNKTNLNKSERIITLHRMFSYHRENKKSITKRYFKNQMFGH